MYRVPTAMSLATEILQLVLPLIDPDPVDVTDPTSPYYDVQIKLDDLINQHIAGLRSDIQIDTAMQIGIQYEERIRALEEKIKSNVVVNSIDTFYEMTMPDFDFPDVEIGGMKNCADAGKYKFE
jgi:hypothetical protein